MPGEHEMHAKSWLLWPERLETWRAGCMPAQKAFAEVIRAIAKFEPVNICASAAQYNAVSQLFAVGSGRDEFTITVVSMESNDSWMRDVGPTFVINNSAASDSDRKSEVRGIDWEFNAWGGAVDGLYADWAKDDLVAGQICALQNLSSYRTQGFVLEGGSIHVDGEGTCIVTEACLLSAGRNPHLSKQEIEAKLCSYLGVRKCIWLPNGIHGDETNEHVDNMIHFLRPTQVILAWTDDENDVQWHYSHAALRILENERDALGRPFVVTKIHVPSAMHISEEEHASFGSHMSDSLGKAGDRLPASYCNCYLVNGGLIVPVFGDAVYDEKALSALRELVPDRIVTPVYTREILLGGGNIHCITQQQPF